MTRTWKIVILIAVILLVGGAVLAGVGFMTGANLGRVAEAVPTDAVSGALHYVGSFVRSLLGIAPLA